MIAGEYRIHAFPRSVAMPHLQEAFGRWDSCPRCQSMFDLTEGKSLVGIADIRDAFNTITMPHGIRCTVALLNYCDKDGKPDGLRTHQQITFNCVLPVGNGTAEYTSELIPPGQSVMMAAAAVANRVVNAAATAQRAAEINE